MRLSRTARALCAALALGLPAAAPLSEQAIQYEDDRLYLPVQFADKPPEWFILDTGSTSTAIDNDVAAAWGLEAKDAGTTSGAGNGRTAIGKVDDVTLSAAGQIFGFDEVNTAPLSALLPRFTGRRAPGIFGSRIFHDYVVELDLPRNTLRLYGKATFGYQGPGAVVPIEIEDGVPFTTATLTLPNGETLAGRFLIDTGAKATLLLTESFAAEHKLMDALPAHVDSPLGSGIGGPTTYRFVRMGSAEIAGQPSTALTGPIAGLSLNGSLKIDGLAGLIGADYLRRFRVIFDYGRQRMILESAFDANGPSDFDMSGLFFTASGADLHTYTVTTVQPGSPAEGAGVMAGDVLTKIELLPPSQVTLSALRLLLARKPGKTLYLQFDRGGRPVKAEITLRRLI